MKKSSFILLFLLLMYSCDDKGKCLNRSIKFSTKEISGEWSGKDDLYNFNQYEVKLTLNENSTYKLRVYRNEKEEFELNQDGTFSTSVKEMKNLEGEGLYEHFLHLDWKTPYGLRTSIYQIIYIINPASGSQRKTAKTDFYEKGFYLSPEKVYVTSGSTNSGIILKGEF